MVFLQDYRHFSTSVVSALEAVSTEYPEEARPILAAYQNDLLTPDIPEQVRLLNPLHYISDAQARHAQHFRIRVGARDADTSFSISMTLYLLLQKAGFDADYALIWDAPHSEADYPGEILDWIDKISKSKKV